MPRSWPQALLPLLLLACGDKDGHDHDAGSTDGGTADGGTADGGAGDGGGGGGGGECSNVFPIKAEGTTWVYRYTGATTGTWTMVAMGAEDYEGQSAWRIDGSGDLSGTGYSQTWQMSTWYGCESDGVHMLGSEMSYDGVAGGTTYSGWSKTVYTTPPLVSPSNLQNGDSWTASYAGTTESSSGPAQSFSFTQTAEVTGTASVTVPAGTFDTLVVSYSSQGTSWEQNIAEDVGAVLGTDFELSSFTR